ncbi:hypothetical protein FZX02_03915 [Synechococcus sp. MU1644]|nr:hypothetical protein [Synechococcus sp. MU1644]
MNSIESAKYQETPAYGVAEQFEERIRALEAALKKERRQKVGANLRSMVLFVMACAAAAVAFFVWNGPDGQVAKADQEREAAFDARDAAIEDLGAAEKTIANQLETITGFDEFLPLADMTWEVRRLNTQLKGYAQEFATRPTPGLDRDSTINVEATPETLNWVNFRLMELQTEEMRLQDAIANFQSWLDRRVEAPPVEVCVPNNPFRPGNGAPDCEYGDDGPTDGGGNVKREN